MISAQFMEDQDQTLDQDLILDSHGSWLWVAFRNIFLSLEKVLINRNIAKYILKSGRENIGFILHFRLLDQLKPFLPSIKTFHQW